MLTAQRKNPLGLTLGIGSSTDGYSCAMSPAALRLARGPEGDSLLYKKRCEVQAVLLFAVAGAAVCRSIKRPLQRGHVAGMGHHASA